MIHFVGNKQLTDKSDSQATVQAAFDYLTDKKTIAVDTETSSLNPLYADLVGVAFSYAPNKACYIPIGHKNIKGIKKEIVLKKIKSLLEDPSIKKVGQNIKFDFIILRQNNFFNIRSFCSENFFFNSSYRQHFSS